MVAIHIDGIRLELDKGHNLVRSATQGMTSTTTREDSQVNYGAALSTKYRDGVGGVRVQAGAKRLRLKST